MEPDYPDNNDYSEIIDNEIYDQFPDRQKKPEPEDDYKPVLTYIIIIINVLFFFTEIILGGSENSDTVLKMGAAYTPYILEKHEWYRLILPIFMHFGIEHIISNTLALFAMGQYVEAYFGKVKFIIIYMLSGIAGNVLTVLVESMTGVYAISVGASGAICGLLGAMVIFAIDSHTRKMFPLPRIIFALVLVLLPGFTDATVNATAHLGGVAAGFTIALLMYLFSERKRHSSTLY